jgi:hypothetical protein
LLETLNIFAIRANYMAQFREYLEREGVESQGHVEFPLAIRPNRDFLRKGLLVPRIPEDSPFPRECGILLEPDPAAEVSVDMSAKVESIRSGTSGVQAISATAGREQVIPPGSLELLDWEDIYLNILEYKEQLGFANLVIQPDHPRRILSHDPRLYRLIAEEQVVKPTSFADSALLREAVLTILRKYVERFYRVQQERWDSAHMVYRRLETSDSNFQDYLVRIPRSEAALIKAVQALLAEGKRIYEQETHSLPNIHFDRHLYQPLLVRRDDKIESVPPRLEASEERFVRDIRDYCGKEAARSLAGKEIFLLRNLTRGKGIGFFDKEGFYPDFILWIKEGMRQRIVFVEPHGMRYEKGYWADDKVKLHERLAQLSSEMANRAALKGISLDSFVVSMTRYDELRNYYGEGKWAKADFAKAHVLFFEHEDYPDALFKT